MNAQRKRVTDGKLPLPVGDSDWTRIVQRTYCIDKTLMIKDLVDAETRVALFTRPRRFGKTTAMQMLKTFFEKRVGRDGKLVDNAPLFHDKQIWAAGEKYRALCGKFPVIYLTFKDHKAMNWEDAKRNLIDTIGFECGRHRDAGALRGLSGEKLDQLLSIAALKADINTVANALGLLAEALDTSDIVIDETTGERGRKPVILIDEYDSPVNSASTYGYYDEMVSFMRTFLPGAMKDNAHVEMGIMTGVLRVAKEGILSGLNNLMVYTVFENRFSQYFGFTKNEVEEMCAYYGVPERMAEIESWYDGYDFGGVQVFNPWSVLYYFANDCQPKAYWLDTSSNDLIAELVRDLPHGMAETLVGLLKKDAKDDPPIVPMTAELGPYADIRKRSDTLYALLVSTGYLKVAGEIEFGSCPVLLPNRELEQVFVNDIIAKIREHDARSISQAFLNSVIRRRPAEFKTAISDFLLESVSFFDTAAEGFYHGMLLGFLAELRTSFRVLSNRESGFGRFDIALFPLLEGFPGVIIEVKAADADTDDLDALAAAARAQIDEKSYEADLRAKGVADILKFGLAFRGKRISLASR